jgi:hypothetical protein
MNKRNLRGYLPLIFGFLIVFGCTRLDDLDNLKVVNYDAEFAIPLFSGSASFQDVLEAFDEGTYITILPDNLIQLNYRGDVISKSSDDIFDILSDYNGLPIPILDTVMGVAFDLPNNIDIDLALLKTGLVDWGYQIEHEGPLVVTVTIPNLTKDGQIFTVTKEHDAGVLATVHPTVDISEFTLTPSNDSIFVYYQAFRPNNGFADTLTNFFMRFQDLKASYIEGYLGNELYELPRDTIKIEFFENWTRGEVKFENPKLSVKVENGFGFPVRSQTNVLSILTVEGDSLGLESPALDAGIDFEFPSLEEVGEIKTTLFSFDKNNSNIKDILNSNPVWVDYDIDAIPNPDNDTLIRGFMTDTSAFKVEVEVELPIHGSAKDFVAIDTFSVDFSEYNGVDYAEFKLVADNGIPIAVNLQAYFADDSGQVLDSLFVPTGNVLEAAPVDGSGEVMSRTETITYSTMNSSRFEQVKSAKYIYLQAVFSTTNEGATPVKIYSTQNVDFRMGMKIGVTE